MAMRNGQQSGAGIYLKSGLIITAAHLTAVDAKMSARVAPQGRDREHALVDANGMAFGFGYSRRAGLLTIALPTFAAALEIAQSWIPGRHARMSDFLVDAAALWLGVGLSYAFLKFRMTAIRR